MNKFSIKNSAFISIDNTRTFEDKSLNELYVPEGEQAAIISKKVADICRSAGMLTVNVFDKHTRGHISFASSYTNKKPYDSITYEEVRYWTQERNGLSAQAKFTVKQLQEYLLNSPDQKNKVRPDHAKGWTESSDLMPPLLPNDFIIHLPKGDKVNEHPYGGFIGTVLDRELKKRSIDTIFIGGVATDYCSGETGVQGLDLNYNVYMITDAIRGIKQETVDEMMDLLLSKNVNFIDSEGFKKLIKSPNSVLAS
ncbi:MAG: isochorismatase family protein [candidate division SR1 bacterium]|nr:isochorismatase family protein [candidate division SR1 bacterium]